MELQNEIIELKSILKDANRVERIINYEFNIPKANKLARKVYKRTIAFNHKHPSDAVEDRNASSKDNPYGLNAFTDVKFFNGGFNSNRIFGDTIGDLQTVNSGGCTISNVYNRFLPLIKADINRCEYKLKKQTCTQSDIDKANQYLKQNHVVIKKPLTATPVKDIKGLINSNEKSSGLRDLVCRIANLKGAIVTNRSFLRVQSQWKGLVDFPSINPFNANAASIPLTWSKGLHEDRIAYRKLLKQYRSISDLVSSLLNTVHRYTNSAIFVERREHVWSYDEHITDLRPAEVSDLRKYTVRKDSRPFKQIYHSDLKVLNSIDFNDIDGSLGRIRPLIKPILLQGDKSGVPDYWDHRDKGIKTSLVRNALTQDIRYQHVRTANQALTSRKDRKVFKGFKQNDIKQDQKILKRIQNAGKYLNDNLEPYSTSDLKATVNVLKKSLLRTLFAKNKDNNSFNPNITVSQARIIINDVYRDAANTKDRHYKKRATDLIDWVAKEYPHAKISYRQFNPVGHYIYKKNIKNIKKALA